MIYCERKEAQDPNWTLRYVGMTAERYRPKVSHCLLSLGYIGNGRGFHTLQGLRVRVPGGQGGGPGVWTLIPLYP